MSICLYAFNSICVLFGYHNHYHYVSMAYTFLSFSHVNSPSLLDKQSLHRYLALWRNMSEWADLEGHHVSVFIVAFNVIESLKPRPSAISYQNPAAISLHKLRYFTPEIGR